MSIVIEDNKKFLLMFFPRTTKVLTDESSRLLTLYQLHEQVFGTCCSIDRFTITAISSLHVETFASHGKI